MLKAKREITPDLFVIDQTRCCITWQGDFKFSLLLKDGLTLEDLFDFDEENDFRAFTENYVSIYYSAGRGIRRRDEYYKAMEVGDEWYSFSPEEYGEFTASLSIIVAQVLAGQLVGETDHIDKLRLFYKEAPHYPMTEGNAIDMALRS